MALKIALIVAVCLAGAFASISESAGEIPHDFEGTMNEMDGIREVVSAATLDAYAHGRDPRVIIECFRQEKGNYVKLGERISRMIRDAVTDLAQELRENFQKYGERAEEPLRNIAVTMKTFPQEMWTFIQEKEFTKALELMRESRQIVEENSRELGQIIRDMAEEAPETAKRAEEMAQEIRETARSGCEEIALAFKQCVEEGGPNVPIKPIEGETEE